MDDAAPAEAQAGHAVDEPAADAAPERRKSGTAEPAAEPTAASPVSLSPAKAEAAAVPPATAATADAAEGTLTALPPAPTIEPISSDEIDALDSAAAAYAKKLATLSIVLNAREEVRREEGEGGGLRSSWWAQDRR